MKFFLPSPVVLGLVNVGERKKIDGDLNLIQLQRVTDIDENEASYKSFILNFYITASKKTIYSKLTN